VASLLDFQQAMGFNTWLILVQRSGGQGHGVNAVQRDQYFKILCKVIAACSNKVGQLAENPFYFLAFICLQAADLVIQIKCFQRLDKEGGPACRLVVEDSLDLVSVRLLYRKDPPSLSHGDEPLLQDAFPPQLLQQGLQLTS
jgi:hypothetical protein